MSVNHELPRSAARNSRCLLILLTLLCISLADPGGASARAWPGSSIGAGFGVQVKPERTHPGDLRRIQAIGFGFIRYDMRWEEVESHPGIYNWLPFDRFISSVRSQRLRSLIILSGSNPHYEKTVYMPPSENYGSNTAYAAPSSENSMRAFAAFAAAAVARYGSGDIIWEIWNEPDTIGFWPPKPDARAFAALSNATCRAMRQVAPSATIIGPAVAHLPDPADETYADFVATFLQSPAAACLDAFSVHPYRSANKPPESVIRDYAVKAREFITANTPHGQKLLPIVDGEWGYPSTELAPLQQAAYPLRQRLADLLAGVPLTILYEWQDSVGSSENREAHFGIVKDSQADKPAGMMMEKMLPSIKDAVVVRRLSLGREDYFVVLLQQPDGRYQILFWNGGAQPNRNLGAIHIGDASRGKIRTLHLALVPQLAGLEPADVGSVEAVPEAEIAPGATNVR